MTDEKQALKDVDTFVSTSKGLRSSAEIRTQGALSVLQGKSLGRRTKEVVRIERVGPYEHHYTEEVPDTSEEEARQKEIEELQFRADMLLEEARQIANTTNVLQGFGVDPKVVSARDMRVLKYSGLVHVAEEDEKDEKLFTDGKLKCRMVPVKIIRRYISSDRIVFPVCGSNDKIPKDLDYLDFEGEFDIHDGSIKSFGLKRQDLVQRYGLFSLLHCGCGYCSRPLSFKLPPAPLYMIEEYEVFRRLSLDYEIARLDSHRKSLSLLEFSKRRELRIVQECLHATRDKPGEGWAEARERIKEMPIDWGYKHGNLLNPRFRIGVMVDYSILDSQVADIYLKNQHILVPHECPIQFLHDTENDTYHIGSHYGGPSLLGEQKVLNMLESAYIL